MDCAIWEQKQKCWLFIFVVIITQYSTLDDRNGGLFPYRVHMDTVVGFVCERCGVTGGVRVLVSGLNLQSVLLAIRQHQGGEMVGYLGFGWDNCT